MATGVGVLTPPPVMPISTPQPDERTVAHPGTASGTRVIIDNGETHEYSDKGAPAYPALAKLTQRSTQRHRWRPAATRAPKRAVRQVLRPAKCASGMARLLPSNLPPPRLAEK